MIVSVPLSRTQFIRNLNAVGLIFSTGFLVRCSVPIPKSVVHRISRRLAVRIKDMTIDICRHSNRSVAEYFADNL
jgi:hypothetical protein